MRKNQVMTQSASFQRVVTTHDRAGLSIFHAVETLTPAPIDSGDAAFALVWTTSTVPADNAVGKENGADEAGKTLKGGSVIRMVDMYPGKSSPMHRSFSIDYGIVLSGALELELDSGEIQLLGPGDVVVQRGTNHLWRNPSADTICRIVFVLVEALPVEIDGRVLEEVHP